MTKLPKREDFRDPSEVLIWQMSDLDSQGRARFTVFWLDQYKRSGVAGQIYLANLADFRAREHKAGHPTRIWRNS